MARAVKILFNMANRKNLVCTNLYDVLAEAVSKTEDVKFWGLGHPRFVNEPLQATIKRLYGDDSPDWIITTAYLMAEKGRWIRFKAPPAKDRPWKIATFTTDLHGNHMLKAGVAKYVRTINAANFDATLMLYSKTPWAKRPTMRIDPNYWLKNLKNKPFHCPVWVDPKVYKPSAEKPLYDVSFLGVYERRQYPIRTSIWNDLQGLVKKFGWKALIRTRPPGRSDTRTISKMQKEGHLVGKNYANALSRSKTFIFGNSIYRYPLLKIVEGWMSGTCIVCDQPLTWERMHMETDKNYVRINVKNWRVKLKAILDNESARARIAQKGYETAMKYHTAEVRARELLNFLEANR